MFSRSFRTSFLIYLYCHVFTERRRQEVTAPLHTMESKSTCSDHRTTDPSVHQTPQVWTWKPRFYFLFFIFALGWCESANVSIKFSWKRKTFSLFQLPCLPGNFLETFLIGFGNFASVWYRWRKLSSSTGDFLQTQMSDFWRNKSSITADV